MGLERATVLSFSCHGLRNLSIPSIASCSILLELEQEHPCPVIGVAVQCLVLHQSSSGEAVLVASKILCFFSISLVHHRSERSMPYDSAIK